jgi:acyl-CoA thioesterase I
MKCRGLPVTLALALGACGDAPASDRGAEMRCFVAGQLEGLPAPTYEHSVLAFGDSLFAGYGVCPDQGYPEVLQGALQRRGIDAQVVDAGVSGDTSAAGRQRIAFVLDSLEKRPDLAIVELGGNDLLRGLPVSETRANLAAILAELKRRGIPVLLMGMRSPPNPGPEYQQAFDAIYPSLAAEYDAELVPFFLEPVWDKPDLIQRDRVHPTAEGIEALVAATADEVADALPDDD